MLRCASGRPAAAASSAPAAALDRWQALSRRAASRRLLPQYASAKKCTPVRYSAASASGLCRSTASSSVHAPATSAGSPVSTTCATATEWRWQRQGCVAWGWLDRQAGVSGHACAGRCT